MQEWSAVLKTITDKIGEFLNIFDLSFLVSGAACLSGIYCVYITLNEPLDNFNMPILVMAAYISGLVCFTIGRWARKDLRRNQYETTLNTRIKENATAHNIESIPEYNMYFQNKEFLSGLYVRMWADLRGAKKLRSSLTIINRYWVMSATYDGLAVGCLIWLGALELWWQKNGVSVISLIIVESNADSINMLQFWVSILMVPIILFMAYRCLVEAERYSKHQIEEVIATIASWKNYHNNIGCESKESGDERS